MDIGLLKKNSCISWKDAIAIRMAAYNILIPLLRPARINFQKKLRNSVAKGGEKKFTVKLKEIRFIVNRRSYEGRTEADCSPNFHRLFY